MIRKIRGFFPTRLQDKAGLLAARPTDVIQSGGFTLVELLVVIAIIGVLSSIVLASLNTARAKGRDARRVSDIKTIQLALELYYDANGTFPTNIYGSPSPLVSGGYISSVPFDPSFTTPCTTDSGTGCYTYVALNSTGGTCSTATSYHLGAALEQAGNAALSSDADACPGTSGNAGTACGGASNGVHDTNACNTNGVSDFNGLSASTPCNATAGTESCFDATP